MNKEEFLRQLSKELHAPVKKHFQRAHVMISGKNETWATDIADMNDVIKYNKKFRYILTVIDCFTRFAWAFALKDKTGKTVASTFASLFQSSKQVPKHLWCDQGGEFLNKHMDELREKHGISIYHTHGEHKSSYIERFNRTLKTMMWKRFTEFQTYNWVDMLDDLIDEYNSRVHSSIKMSPKDAIKAKNQSYLKELEREKIAPSFTHEPKFKLGDYVRISRYKNIFEKGYTHNWSLEIFKIIGITQWNVPIYYLEDWEGNKIQGGFYTDELKLTVLHDTFLIEKILKRKKQDGKNLVYVKWLGFNHPSWIAEDDILAD